TLIFFVRAIIATITDPRSVNTSSGITAPVMRPERAGVVVTVFLIVTVGLRKRGIQIDKWMDSVPKGERHKNRKSEKERTRRERMREDRSRNEHNREYRSHRISRRRRCID